MGPWTNHDSPTGTAKRDGKLNGNNPTSLFQDDRGRIWVSTFREFGYLEDGRFTTIKGIPEGNKPSIAQDTAGNVWGHRLVCWSFSNLA
jgi:Two component regulator propeller